MTVSALLLAWLAATASAQTPLPPAPEASLKPEEASDRSRESFEALFRKSPRRLLEESVQACDYSCVQRERQARDLMPRPEDDSSERAPATGFTFNKDSYDPELKYTRGYRFERESVEANVLRPSPKVFLGFGAARERHRDLAASSLEVRRGYLFLNIHLDRKRSDGDAGGILVLAPSVTYREVQIAPTKQRSKEGVYSLRDLTRP